MAHAQKTLPHDGDVDAFIAAVANPKRRADAATLAHLMQQATGEPPVMWGTSIIGFGSVTYPYARGGHGIAPRVGFSPRSNRLVLYLPLQQEAVRRHLAALGPHESSVACVYVKSLADIDLAVLRTMIEASFEDRPAT